MQDTMNIAVILPAAGVGQRFKEANDAARNKLEVDLAGRPVFQRSVELFMGRPSVGQIILAVHPQHMDEFKFRWGDKLAFHGVDVVPGSVTERWETVLRAIEHVKDSCTHIAVHDAARPLTSKTLIDRLFDAAANYDAVIPGLPIVSTLRRVEPITDSEKVTDPLDDILGAEARPTASVHKAMETVDRDGIVAVQTPQVFRASVLKQAYAAIAEASADSATLQGITDDASLVTAIGEPVHVVEGESRNIKITYADDVDLARALVERADKLNQKDLAARRLFADDDDD